MSDRKKPYRLTFEPRAKYLYAHIHAETTTRAIALRYLRQIAEECVRLKYERLLIERDVPVMLSDSDIFSTTNDFLDMIRHVRVAFVNPHVTHKAAMKFAMLVGTNRGGQFHAHKTVHEAEQWLLAGLRVS